MKEEEPLPAQEAGVEPDDRASTTPAQEAAKARLDVLYRVFQMFQNRARRNDGYTTLTRGSLEAIFDRLIESYDFSGVPFCRTCVPPSAEDMPSLSLVYHLDNAAVCRHLGIGKELQVVDVQDYI